MRFDVLTIFPEVFLEYLATSILGRAKEAGLLETQFWNVRDYATDKHKTVDDSPYGGGPGMVMKVEPIDKALSALKSQTQMTNVKLRGNHVALRNAQKRKTVVLSARGEQFTQAKAAEYAKLDQLILICGRYEGIDQRVADHLADEELSIGPYVLAGGELAALVVLEAVARLIPGVLGNEASLIEESFSTTYPLQPTTSLEYPQYTKPEEYRDWKVPEVLLSGNHQAIAQWRRANAKSKESKEK